MSRKRLVQLFMASPIGTMDHIYETCPAMRRECRYPFAVALITDDDDPYDASVCGWCQRVHRARAARLRPA